MNRTTASIAAVVAIVIGSLTMACSGDDGGAGSSTSVVTVDPVAQIPSSDGDSCVDPIGDIGDVAGMTVEQGTLSEPAGIDLVEVSATVDGDMLDVEFNTAGPIDTVPNAQFVLSQGEPFQSTAYEFRAQREALGPWELIAVSWDTGKEVRTSVAVAPTVEGATLRFSVPRDQLPPIATYLAFGASAEVADGADKDELADVVFDECSRLSSSVDSTTATAG